METIAGGSSELPLRFEAVIDGGRASKKQVTDTGGPSSAHLVLSNDDLFIEILLRLPAISLILFKSVCRRWLSLITDPSFTLRRSQIPNIDPPSVLFIQRPIPTSGYDFVPLDTRIPGNRSPIISNTTFSFGPDAGKVEILQSCNGLLLCCMRHNKFYVYNPSNDLCKMLPQRHDANVIGLIGGMKMAFDPTKSPHYKVMYAGDIRDHLGSSIQIQIYSSETGNWRVWGDRFPIQCFPGFCHGIYWNDAIHWLDFVNGALHFKLDLEHQLLTSLPTPGTLDGTMRRDYKLFESRGCLLLAYMAISNTHLNVYEMRNEWSVKYLVNLDDIMLLFPQTSSLATQRDCFVVRCIVVGEREEDSYLVMEVFGKLVQYKIVSKTLRTIYHFASTRPPVPESTKFGSFQFIASLAGV